MTDYKPKLIEVALPLAAINAAVAAEGSIGQRPHPKSLHRWWARRPQAAARAVIWASLVDDPSGDASLSAEAQQSERIRLFRLLDELVQWDGLGEPDILVKARSEIARCCPNGVPTVVDPFGGGGAIPLEAQRLGLRSRSGDLNPVAVLIQRAMTQIPVRFAGRPPVSGDGSRLGSWSGVAGLAEDVAAYGSLVEEEVAKRIGNLYPQQTDELGNRVTPIAYIWARTVRSPDPTWKGEVPLVASWTLAAKKGSDRVWIEPVIDRERMRITYRVRSGGSPKAERTVTRGSGRCLATGAAMTGDYIREEAVAGRMGAELMAIVADGPAGRCYLEATPEQSEEIRSLDPPSGLPTQAVPYPNHDVDRLPMYGMEAWADAYSVRQQIAMTTFVDVVKGMRERILSDAVTAGMPSDGVPFRDGGLGADAYADAVVTYLSFAVDKLADFSSTLCSWNAPNSQFRYVFSRQAIAMTWDFAEVNPLSGQMGSWRAQITAIARSIENCLGVGAYEGQVLQVDARSHLGLVDNVVVSTDPPYYDNISYADVSDYFWIWLRECLSTVWPDETATLLTPKASELIANQYRAGSRSAAREHFESGMSELMQAMRSAQTSSSPATIYYAYKATESADGEVRSTGWDTFVQAVVGSGLQVVATWPLRTERQGRLIDLGSNALASSIVLVCRARDDAAPLASRGEFVSALREELPEAVKLLQSGNIAPVDIAQSTIGPGVKVFSRYAKVIEADGSSMSVSAALRIINDVLGEVLDGEEAELDSDTRFAVTWYAQHGFNPGRSGDADSQARAKNTSLAGLQQAGVGEARAGQFRLFERHELDPGWSPVGDSRLTVWEATQHLVAALERSESEAAQLLHRLGGYGDGARQLAYLLFQKATDQGWAEEAGVYNGLITAWPTLAGSAASVRNEDGQGRML